jgi:DNA-binding transcriptional ArsR family regulator
VLDDRLCSALAECKKEIDQGGDLVSTTQRAGQRKKGIEEVVAYAIGHRIRVHILIVLNEGTYTPAEIAEIIDEPLNNVSNHIRELVENGSIEVAKTEQRRNATQHWYRAIEMPYYSDDDIANMTWQERQVTAGLVIQSMMAEVMAGLWAGRMHDDPRVWLSWDWFNLDEQGREDLADEQARSWERIQQIEVEATNRRAKSGEESTSFIATQLGFRRARKAPVPSRGSQNRD